MLRSPYVGHPLGLALEQFQGNVHRYSEGSGIAARKLAAANSVRLSSCGSPALFHVQQSVSVCLVRGNPTSGSPRFRTTAQPVPVIYFVGTFAAPGE